MAPHFKSKIREEFLDVTEAVVSVSEEMVKALEQERKARKLETIPEAIRSVLGEYFKTKLNE